MDSIPGSPPYLPGPMTCRVLNLLCEGYRDKDIAHFLGNTPATVSKHMALAAKALGVPPGRRVLLALAWARACPAINEPDSQSPQADPGGPIYGLIDPVTRKRVVAPRTPAYGRDVVYEEVYTPRRSTALRPCGSGRRPLHALTRADVGYGRITSHARWILRDRPRQCHRCTYSQFLDVCHVKPVRSFASDALVAEINAPENLIYLCPNCHREFDAGLWTLPEGSLPLAPAVGTTPPRTAWSSRYHGVSWDKSTERWRAFILSSGRRHYLGRFTDERAAARAYNDAARRLHGERAVLNDVD